MAQFIGQIVVLVIFLLLGLISGKILEYRHLKSLALREKKLKTIKLCNLKKIPSTVLIDSTHLVSGSVVIATDYFKVFTAALRNLFGGEMKTYRSLMTRARREAVARMLEEAYEIGADSVWNIRLETSTIQGKQKKKAGGIEVIAYGTAIKTK